MTTIVIMPGGFHPFHAGHFALYQSAQKAFPKAEVFVAATNDTSARPFPFPVKEKLAKLAGVEPGHFVQVKSPFRAEEITSRFNPAKDVLIFVRSEKDANKPPQPGGVKKDGSPSYLQPLQGQTRYEPFSKHAYMAYLPTVEFGPGMTSATEIRTAWPTLNERRKTALVMSLYPRTQGNAKLAATVVGLLDAAIGTQDMAEGSLNEFAPGGAEGAGPYAYGIALKEMAELYAKGEFDLDDVIGMDTTSQNQSDAEEINSVADAFMNRGMEAGREAYSMVDTMVQEDMDEYLHSQGFNVDADIHAEYQNDVDRYNNSPAGQADKDQQAQQDAEWEEDLPTWRAAQVEIAAVDPKNQSSVLHSVQFDARLYNSSVGQLKSTLEQQLNKIKQSTPGGVIRITLGGKPTDIQGILAQFKQLSNKPSGVAEGSLKEFAPGTGDEGGEDPYKYPRPKRYARSADYFGQFEADHFDREKFDDATGVFKGYWGQTPIAYFKFANPAQTGSDDPGMGWYYEPQSISRGDDGSTRPDVDRSAERKQQELGMIDQFLKSGQTPKPGSQIFQLMKRHGMTEGAPIVVAQAPIHIRNPKKPEPQKLDLSKIGTPAKPPSSEKRGVKGRPGQRPMPKYDEGMVEAGKKCPPATQDIGINLQNRQKAIDEYGYGPLNPDMPNNKFWMKKVDEWNLDSMEEAKQSLCGNCAAFDVRQDTLDCIAQGIDSDSPEDAAGVIDAGDLGYCKFLKFKCASRRTCDAWVTGGPLQDKPVDENQGWAATYNESSDYIEEKWTAKYKSSINCASPKGFSQKAHCAGRKK